MSRGTEWIPMDKNLKIEFKSIRRPFSRIEAMYSYTLDVDCGKVGTIAGYAALWQWSRNKVRKFITEIRSEKGHTKDSKRTDQGHPIHFIDKAFWSKKDRSGTDKGQTKDTTNNPKSYNPKEKKKIKKKSFSPPTQKEVIEYFLENGFSEQSAIKAWEYYEAGDWKDSKGNQVRSWKQKMRGVWFKDENKVNGGQNGKKPLNGAGINYTGHDNRPPVIPTRTPTYE